MKRKALWMAGLSVALLLTTFYACQKENQKEKEITSGGSIAKNIGPCDGHGGSTGRGGVSWQLATLRSNCNRGIGFRCGHTFYAECNDGVIVKWHDDAPAPDSYPRPGKAKFLISLDKLQLSFVTPIPADEPRDLPFEVEDDVVEVLPDDFELDGVHYSQLIIKQGAYPIDYNDGEFGSVVLKIKLVP